MTAFSRPPGAAEPIRLSDEADFFLGDLHVRPSLREVRWSGRSEQIEPRVMQVLVGLARAGGTVVSREELIVRCWDGRIVGEASINRCISKLRELSESGSPRSFTIETIPRVGYRLMSASEPAVGDKAEKAGPWAAATAVPVTPHRRRAYWLVGLGAAVLLVAATALYAFRVVPLTPRSPAVSLAARRPSIAVLPFKNLSSDKDAGDLAAGVQDEILTRLAKIGSLKVISRTSTDQFAGSAANVPAIARELGVANVLEGNVQKSGNNIRINVQLIRAASDDHIWAEDYDRNVGDVLSVESEVASTIATVLAAKMTPVERRAIAVRPTANPHAYDLYLRALTFAHKNDPASLRTAEQFLTDATRIDPKFALAWAWLARNEAFMHFGDDLATVRRGVAHAALAKALALQADLPEAQAARGFYLYYGEMNYPAAERELKQVHARWPNNAEALEALGLILRRRGELKQSAQAFSNLVVLDPLVPNHRIILAGLQHSSADAMRVLDAALQIWPDNEAIIEQKASLYQQMGRLDLAAEQLKNARPTPYNFAVFGCQYWLGRRFQQGATFIRSIIVQDQENPGGDSVELETALGDFLRMSGDAKGAKEAYPLALGDLMSRLKKQPNNPDLIMALPQIYAGLGERELALKSADHTLAVVRASGDALEEANAEYVRARMLARLGDRDEAIANVARLLKTSGIVTPGQLRLDPDFDRLRGDPRFERSLVAGAVEPIVQGR